MKFKNLFQLLSFIFISLNSIAQNDDLHDAKIIGSIAVGSQEVTSVYDEVTGCNHKTSLHSAGIFLQMNLYKF